MLSTLTSSKYKELLDKVGVMKPHEVEARQTILFEKYIETILIEANCLANMMNTGVIPACLKDLKTYENTGLYEERAMFFNSLIDSVKGLLSQIEALPENDLEAKSRFCVDSIIPMMKNVREKSDLAERMISRSLWPFPSYQKMLYRATTNHDPEQSFESSSFYQD